MKKFGCNKLFLWGVALVASMLLSYPVLAAVITPLDPEGHALATSDWAGGFPCIIDAAAGTTAIECSSNTTTLGGKTFDMSGRGEVLGVIVSSIASTSYLVFRDTTVPNVTSSTAAIVFAQSSGTSPTSGGTTSGTTQFFKFPVPLQFESGISVNASAAPTFPGIWTVIFRPLNKVVD